MKTPEKICFTFTIDARASEALAQLIKRMAYNAHRRLLQVARPRKPHPAQSGLRTGIAEAAAPVAEEFDECGRR